MTGKNLHWPVMGGASETSLWPCRQGQNNCNRHASRGGSRFGAVEPVLAYRLARLKSRPE